MSASYELLTSLFLEEMSALDTFVTAREREDRQLPAREDPDVRRILEAIAFFSARTRAAARASTRAAVERIAGGTLDDLLPVAPASMLISAKPTAQLAEPVTVPSGTELRVRAADGRVGRFSTELPITVIPAEIEGAKVVDGDRRVTLQIKLRALRAFRAPRVVSLHVRKLNDYRASLAVHDALARCTTRVTALVDGKTEVACQVSFDALPPRRLDEETGDAGPLARAREFFHMPDRALYLHVEMEPTSFTTLAITLELDERFPTDVAIGKDTFHLAVTPAANVWNDYAEPVLCDGMRDGYRIRAPGAELSEVELHRVKGVYRTGGGGFVPVPPAALSQEGDAYELTDVEDAPHVSLRFKGAFDKPIKVMIDARWSQPALWSGAAGKITVEAHRRHLPGVSLGMLGPMRRPEPSPLARSPARALDLLSLRMRPSLDRRALSGVLEMLGTTAAGPYLGAHTWVDDLSAVEEPDPAQPSGGIRRRYDLTLRERSPEDGPLVRALSAQIEALLKSWTEQAVIVNSSVVSEARRRSSGALP